MEDFTGHYSTEESKNLTWHFLGQPIVTVELINENFSISVLLNPG